VTSWDYHSAPKSDAQGRIVLDPAPAGDVVVSCLSSSRRTSNPSIAMALKAGARASVVLWTAELLADWPSTIGVEFAPGLPAPRIERVRAHSPAGIAGLVAGDLIVAIDGVAVDGLNWAGVTHLLDSHAVGTEVTVAIRRSSTLKTVTVKTEPRRYQ
jgi:predicted metalloprotease with PDZ domain